MPNSPLYPSTSPQSATTTRRQLLLAAPIAAAGLAALSPLSLAAGPPPEDRREQFLRAVAEGDISAVAWFLDRNLELLAIVDDAGRSPFALALVNRHRPVADLLRSRGYEPDLHESALAGDWERMAALAEETPAAVNENHPIGGTVFYAAAHTVTQATPTWCRVDPAVSAPCASRSNTRT